LASRTKDRDSAGNDGRRAAVIADGDVFVVGEQRLVRAEELTDTCGVMDGGVEVSVVGDVDRFDEGRAGDGVERGLGGLSAVRVNIGVEESGESLAEQSPGAMAERQERIESGSLADGGQGRGKEVRRSTGVEVEEVSANGNAEVLLAFQFEGSVGKMGEGEVCRGLIRFGKPAWMGLGGSFCHGE
jgi:hypothetical protein